MMAERDPEMIDRREDAPRSITERWADAETPSAFDVVDTPEPAPDGAVLEDPDPQRVPYGTTF